MSLSAVQVVGRVVDEAYRTSLAGVQVSVFGSGRDDVERRQLATTRTDAGGNFLLRYVEETSGESGPYHLEVADQGQARPITQGPEAWTLEPPAGLVELVVRGADPEVDCDCDIALGSHPLPDPAQGVQSGPAFNGTPLDVAHIVGTVRSATGAPVANVRLRLTGRARPDLPVPALPTGGTPEDAALLDTYSDWAGQTVELARTHTNADGTFHLLVPAEERASLGAFVGQGWPESSAGIYQAWNTALTSPAILTLHVEVPLDLAGAVDATVSPSFTTLYKTLQASPLVVRSLHDACDHAMDFVVAETGLATDTEFGRLDAALGSVKELYFDTSAESVRPGFDLVDAASYALQLGLPAEQVAAYFVAHRMAYECDVLERRTQGVLTGAYPPALGNHTHERAYALIRMGLPSSVVEILGVSATELTRALVRAGLTGIIAPLDSPDLDGFLAASFDAAVGRQLLPSSGASAPPTGFRKNTLGNSMLRSVSGAGALEGAVRFLRLAEEFRRSDFAGKPADDPALWEPTGQIWTMVQNGDSWSGPTWPALGISPLVPTLSDNIVLDDLVLGVSDVVGNVRSLSLGPADVGGVAQPDLVSGVPVGDLPSPFEDHSTYYAAVMKRAQGRFWNSTLAAALGSVSSSVPSGVDLRSWRPTDASSLSGGEAELREIRRVQAFETVVPEGVAADTITTLMGSGYASPRGITTRGLTRLQDTVGLDPESSKQVFHRSTVSTLAAMNLFALTHPNAGGGGTKAPASPGSFLHTDPIPVEYKLHETVVESGPDLQGYPTYEPWRTAFSPLAYLDDLLRWIDARGDLSALLDRRPDLQHIALSRANTFDTVAYLDLALEVMEVAAATGFDGAYVPFTTALDTAESATRPGGQQTRLFARAYQGTPSLQTRAWPVQVPYDLPVERIDAHLNLAGSSWGHGMRVLRSSSVADATLHGATLGLNTTATALFTATTDPSTSEVPAPPTTASVPEFLAHFGMSLVDAKDLVHMRVLFPANDRTIAATEDFSDLEFDAAWSSAEGHRAIRLLRLQHATGWSLHELDQALRGVYGKGNVFTTPLPDPLDVREDALIHTGGVKRLVERTGLDVWEVAAWFTELDPVGDRESGLGSYHHVYLRDLPASESRDDGTTAHALTLDGTEVVGVAETFADHAEAIQGALGVDEAAFELLTTGMTNLSLTDLSAAWRPVSLARHLGVDVQDLLRLIELWGADVFASPDATHAFLDALDTLHRAELTPSATLDILDGEHHSQDVSSLPSDPDVAAVASRIAAELTTLQDELAGMGGHIDPDIDPAGNLRPLLERYLDQADVSAILEDVVSETSVDLTPLQDALDGVTVPSSETPSATRSTVLAASTEYEARGLITQHVSAWLPRTVDPVIAPWVTMSDGSGSLLSVALAGGDLTGPLRTIARSALLARVADWDEGWSHWFTTTAGLDGDGLLTPTSLPADATAAAGELPRLVQTLAFGHLDQDLPRDGTPLWAIWDAEDVDELARRLGSSALTHLETLLGETFSQDFNTFERLIRAGIYLRSLRLTADNPVLPTVFHPSGLLTLDDADVIIAAVRSTFGPLEAWQTASDPVRDGLRERRRQALLEHLRHPDGADSMTANELYEQLLIDVEMSACGRTSRVKQAISTVQQYILRAILGYESSLPINEDDRRDWKWMRAYRVWEAARRVFLYPENWLRPELRTDKTPLFEEFENAISAEQLEDSVVERATLAYLQGLHEIASPHVLAVYNEELGSSPTRGGDVHVVARTPAEPYRYYYRSRVADRWSPWEALDLGIGGDHVMLVRFEGRFQVIWVSFEDKGETSNKETSDGEGYRRRHATGVRIHWSIRTEEGWTKPQISNQMRVAWWVGWEEQYDSFTFRTQEALQDGKPVLRLWYMGCGRDEGYPREYRDEQYEPRRVATWRTATQQWVAQGPSTADQLAPAVATTSFYGPVRAGALARRLQIATGVNGEDGNCDVVVKSVSITSRPQDFVTPTQVFRFGSNGAFAMRTSVGPYLLEPAGSDAEFTGGSKAPGAGTASEPVRDTARADIRSTTRQLGLVSGDLGRTACIFQDAGLNDAFSHDAPDGTSTTADVTTWTASLFYHPYVTTLLEQTYRHGVYATLRGSASFDGTARLFRQALDEGTDPSTFVGNTTVEPDLSALPAGLPEEVFEFGADQAYGVYNWELFFHMPLLVATRFRELGRFEEAIRWLQVVFDPSDNSGTDRIWRFGPFAPSMSETRNAQIEATLAGTADMAAAMAYWVQDPFDAHRAARVRTNAYRRWTVLSYIDTLIEWGDERFTRYSVESLNEARQLYVMALNIAGPRPTTYDAPPADTGLTVSDMLTGSIGEPDGGLGAEAWSNVRTTSLVLTEGIPSAIPGSSDFFAVPANERLLSIWDTLEDRLYKIRHCLNIEGEYQPVPLFEPPIDPGMLVDARGSGASIASAVMSLRTPLPHHRFSTTWQRAVALTGTLKSLSGALLSAMEKRDAEKLSLLRGSQELELLERVIQIREEQVTEALNYVDQIARSYEITEQRKEYYEGLIDKGRNAWEHYQQKMELLSMAHSGTQAVVGMVNTGFSVLPKVAGGVVGFMPTAEAQSDASETAKTPGRAALVALGHLRTVLAHLGTLAGLEAAYARRKQEWQQQVDQATLELESLDHQKAIADIRLEVARKELQNQRRQIEHSKVVQAFMRTKHTNQELYHWMVEELRTLCFRTYQMAFDMALRAQACFARETALDTRYVTAGHWDSGHHGLLAGERLQLELERLDSAYAAQDQREYELTRSISLADLDGTALERLKRDGFCFFQVPEVLLDLDAPGHYLRRIRRLGVSIPCVTSPQSQVYAKLTLLSSTLHTNAARDAVTESTPESIVTSVGQDDTGTFGNQDSRYLPFEYRGAVDSIWKVELLDRALPQFDHESITDVVLTLAYTARDGGEAAAAAARSNALTAINAMSTGTMLTAPFDASPPTPTSNGAMVVLSCAHHFPDAWHAFNNPESGATTQEAVFDLDAAPVPWPHRALASSIQSARVVVVPKGASVSISLDATISHTSGSFGDGDATLAGSAGSDLADMPQGEVGTTGSFPGLDGELTVQLTSSQLAPLDELADILVFLQYDLSAPSS